MSAPTITVTPSVSLPPAVAALLADANWSEGAAYIEVRIDAAGEWIETSMMDRDTADELAHAMLGTGDVADVHVWESDPFTRDRYGE